MFPNRALRTLLLSAACLALPATGQAQDGIQLEEVIVSGGLTGVAADAYGRAATVVDRAEIERRGIASVQDALRAIPGVAVSGAGASLTQVRIRGGEGRQTLILIDGVEATGGSDEYILTGLETANIERIEVLRGPQSVYYGSNASAGVINIITTKGAPGLHYGGSAELGNGYGVSGHVSQRTERGGLSFYLSRRDDRGYDQSGSGGEKDGIRRTTAGLSGDWKATAELSFGFVLRRSTETYDSDSADSNATRYQDYVVDDPSQFSDRDETTGALWAEYAAAGGRVLHRLEYQESIYKQGYNGWPPTRGQTSKLKYRLSIGLDGRPAQDSAHLLNLLAEAQKDKDSSAPTNKRDSRSVALEYRGRFDNGLDLQAGVRHDTNTPFRDFTSWNLGLSWQVPQTAIRLHASAGTGLVNPSYFQLYANYSFGNMVYVGNPGLKPEINRGFDIGAEAQFLGGRGLIDVTYFNETLRDEIEAYFVSSTGGTSTYSYRNQTGKSPRQGVEITGRLQATDRLALAMNYTYLDARNPNGSVEVRRPRHELGLSASLATFGGRGHVTMDVRHVSGNYDSQFFGSYATAKLPAFTTLGLSAGYDLTENLRLTGRIVNLTDAKGMDVWGYATQGRTAYVGLQAKW